MLVPVLLLHTVDVAETAARSEPRVFGSHAAAFVLVGVHCEMRLDLVIHFRFHSAAPEQTEEPPSQQAQTRHTAFSGSANLPTTRAMRSQLFISSASRFSPVRVIE